MNLLLEIGCEELPASAVDLAVNHLPAALKSALDTARISAGQIEAFGTPRRLILTAQNLAHKQEDLSIEVQGPKAEIAFNADGSLTPAGLGFLNGRKIDPKNAYAKETSKGQVLAAQLHEAGELTSVVLSKLLPEIISQIPFAKTMKWEASKSRFSRPVRWLLCLLGEHVVGFEFAGVRSSNKTCGHRFLAPEFAEVTEKTYFDFLASHFVIFDKAKRKEMITREAHALAKSAGGVWREDPELLETVANLVEYPWPILGHFDAHYLEIPPEILICEMREHQKYFAITDASGKLLPNFVVVAGSKPEHPTQLAAGNARVLKARFEDGAFYYREDLKKPLEAYVTQPPQVIMDWFEKLGGIETRAAYLCKADLNTGVVGQFPELQGIIGAYYAEHSGEKPEVVGAIREHYLPRFSGDKVPSTQLGATLSMADRLATLHTRKLPKGSADPYGLRRAAIGLTRIILEHKLAINLHELITNGEILEFVMTRARGVFLENHPVLVVDATSAAANFDLCQWKARIEALEQFDYSAVSAIFKRVNNLVSKAELSAKANPALLKEPSEQALLSAIEQVKTTDDYAATLRQLAELKPTLDKFFEDIMIMSEDLELRNARLWLLSEVQKKAAWVADFSKLTV